MEFFAEKSRFFIDSVALQLGFNDIYHFSRIFKKKTGYTPTQYKQAFG